MYFLAVTTVNPSLFATSSTCLYVPFEYSVRKDMVVSFFVIRLSSFTCSNADDFLGSSVAVCDTSSVVVVVIAEGAGNSGKGLLLISISLSSLSSSGPSTILSNSSAVIGVSITSSLLISSIWLLSSFFCDVWCLHSFRIKVFLNHSC
jgi:hypothetical protein